MNYFRISATFWSLVYLLSLSVPNPHLSDVECLSICPSLPMSCHLIDNYQVYSSLFSFIAPFFPSNTWPFTPISLLLSFSLFFFRYLFWTIHLLFEHVQLWNIRTFRVNHVVFRASRLVWRTVFSEWKEESGTPEWQQIRCFWAQNWLVFLF